MIGDDNAKKAKFAIKLVMAYRHKKKDKVKRAPKKSGYDLISRDDKGHGRKIEVKGTAKPNLSIPDLPSTEIDNGRLRADYLYVVANIGKGRTPKLYILTRKQLARAGEITRIVRYRIPKKAQSTLRKKIKPIPLANI